MLSAAMESALNRPVWSALTTGDRRFAQGGPLALRFPPDIAPFGATIEDSPEAFAALGALIPQDGRVALVSVDKLKPFPGLEIVREEPIIQMVADGETPAPNGPAPIVLGPSYVPEMIRLAQQTNPGPFGPRTHELHVFTDNVSAIALYERLGFAKRKTLRLTVFSRAPGA